MKKPKVDRINLPYASSVASYFGDQGAAQGNSFLGRMFAGGARTVVTKNGPMGRGGVGGSPSGLSGILMNSILRKGGA